MRSPLLAAAAALAGLVPASAATPPPRAVFLAPVVTCESLATLTIANTVITSAVTTPASGSVPATCRVHAVVAHPGAGDAVNIDVWMPIEGWNGRFQGLGGGGYAGGFPQALADPVGQGYAAASTDTGHAGGDGGFALDANGRLNWPLIRDFAYLGIHDMTVVGKAVTAAYFGRQPRFSYFNGCSTGGRQGLAEAQRYPDDYDGILSAAPAINWAGFIPAEFWPQLVMLTANNFLPACKLVQFQQAAIRACDTVGDGVADGVIGDPSRCGFDPRSQIGVATPCGAITAQDAAVIEKIMAGPRSPDGGFLWYGLTPGTSFAALAGASPFPIALTHLGTWVQQNPSWDWRTTTQSRFEQLFVQSDEMFTTVIGTENADLSAFRRSGGKVLIWHGQADQLIFPQGTVDYFGRVTEAMGGSGRTEQFARLFLAPGVAHCAGGLGPAPDNPLNALIEWVERDRAPHVLDGVRRDPSGSIVQTRQICPYPQIATYRGQGDPMNAASFTCRKSTAA
ncbi:MAG TPA: tannase/feruloyl esterase family alpha/beta hydrolase [Candidatus Limnocylindrales bacterium]